MIRLVIGALLVLSAGCASGGETATAPVVAAPDIPDTDIFIGAVDFAAGAPSIGALENATKRKGYDNQPFFLPGEAAFYYVAEGASGKTDIRLYDIARRASQPVFTSENESEYSPRTAPIGGLSYIQENPAGDVTRVHHRAPGSDQGAAIVDFAPLGYYAWLDEGAALAVYYRSEPGSLYRVEIASGETALLHEKIGRTLQSIADGGVLWFSELLDDEGALGAVRYDATSGGLSPLFALPAGATDFFVVLDDAGAALGFLSGSGSKIYWRAGDDPGWNAVADLGPLGVASVSRIALSDDRTRIAVVGEIQN